MSETTTYSLTPIFDKIYNGVINGAKFPEIDLELSGDINTYPAGKLDVCFRKNDNSIEIWPAKNYEQGDERATILWLPWKQGEVTMLNERSIQQAPPKTLFLTYDLTGCKILFLRNGPIWHIDAQVHPGEFFPVVSGSEWVEDNWESGESDLSTYIHRHGQDSKLWDLSDYIKENPTPSREYGKGNIGDALVVGFVNDLKTLNLYMRSEYAAGAWTPLTEAVMTRKK
jgi:hypothetical protein